MSQTQLDRLDIRILRTLSSNGRKPYLEIARECNVSGAAIHQRIAKLNGTGVILGVETLLDPAIMGYNVCAFATLSVGGDLGSAIEHLSAIPEVTDCHVILGEDQLLIKLYARDNAHLSTIINDSIRPLGVVHIQPALSLRAAFHRPFPVLDV